MRGTKNMKERAKKEMEARRRLETKFKKEEREMKGVKKSIKRNRREEETKKKREGREMEN